MINMATKKTKRKEVKPINIDADIHKMLKMQATMEDKNMVEIVESAILENIPDEILKIFKKSKSVRKKEVKITVTEKEVVDDKEEISVVDKKTEEVVDDKETSITSDDELDDETSCYL